MVGKEWTSLVMVMNIDRMVIIHDGDCDGSNEGESPTRVGKELTAQNVAVQGETGARIASSSASASTVVIRNHQVMLRFNVVLQVPPVILFLETAPVLQVTQGLSVSCPAQIKPLEKVANKSVPVPTGTTATTSQEAA